MAHSAHEKSSEAAREVNAEAKTTQQKAQEALGAATHYAAATVDSVARTAGSYAALAKDKLLGEHGHKQLDTLVLQRDLRLP